MHKEKPRLKWFIEEGKLSILFYKAHIILISRLDRDTTRKLQTDISYEYKCQNKTKQKINRNDTK